jgi:hypothetical protein
MALNKQIISAPKLARNVIQAYEVAGGLITGVEFHNSENGRTKSRININGVIEVKLWMQYERMTPALFSIYINIHDGIWMLRTQGYLDEVNVEYDSNTTDQEYTFMQLKEWANDFVDTVYQLKAAEVHGFVVVP